jgi:hypothetical protein
MMPWSMASQSLRPSPVDRRWRRRSGSASESGGESALKPYRKLTRVRAQYGALNPLSPLRSAHRPATKGARVVANRAVRRSCVLVLTPRCLALMITGGQLLSTSHPEGPIMKLTFLGKDSTPNDSPTLYATDRDTYLVQGYTVTDPEALAQMRIPDGETVVEVPKRLMKYLPPEEQQHGDGHS